MNELPSGAAYAGRNRPRENHAAGSFRHLLHQARWPLIGFLGFLIGLGIGYSIYELPIATPPPLPSMNQCLTETLGLFGLKDPPTPAILHDARDHCYSLIQAEGFLADFSIRKLDFFQQYRANGVLMWMVVIITLSGVGFAGWQIWISYQLAMANKTALEGTDSQLILKRDQLALKSSVTGLLILLISFCFFLVFVAYVYRFETPEDRSGRGPPPIANLPMGGLGAPAPKANP